MSATRAQLQEYLTDLEARMPTMVRASPTAESFLPDYLYREIFILDEAGEDDYQWASEQLAEMLRRHGAPVFD